MRVTGARTLCLSRVHESRRMWFTSNFRAIKADAAVVVLETDEGLVGIGEASPYGHPRLIESWVRRLEPHLVGADPAEPGVAPSPHGRDLAYDCAVAGIDCALWDLRGKLAGKPVAALLSPNWPHEVRIYASGGCDYDWRNRPQSLLAEVLGYQQQGLTACKIRIGTRWAWDGVTPDRFLDLVRDLREAVGPDMEIMVDGNCRLTIEEALAVGRGLSRFGITWFEEPIDREDLAGYLRLQDEVDVPLSAGEGFATLEQFLPFIEAHAYDIVQPDTALTGITEGCRIAAAAERNGLDTVPHSWHNGLMAMENAHYVAGLVRPRILEVCMIQGPLQWGMLADPPTISGDRLRIPDRPGLGVSIREGAAEEFPHVEGHYSIEVVR